MLEFPEVTAFSAQLAEAAAGRDVRFVLPPTKPHKFCWFAGDPAAYEAQLSGSRLETAEGFGIFIELGFANGLRLAFNDGVNVRLCPAEKPPKDWQLLLGLSGGVTLAFTVAMYGSLILHGGDYDNDYYRKSRSAVSPLSEAFPDYFRETLAASAPSLSLKAFLATEQRFPGLGNGVLQDILFRSGLHPKRKLGSLCAAEQVRLEEMTVVTLRKLAAAGGRDTEKDLYGRPGGYKTAMSRSGLAVGCPVCGGALVKETYLGGSVYYCPVCQPPEAGRIF